MLKSSITLDQCLHDFSDLNKLVSRKFKSNFADSGYQLINILKEVAEYDNFSINNIGIMHGTFIGMSNDWWKKSEASIKYFSKFFLHNQNDLERVISVFNNSKKIYFG